MRIGIVNDLPLAREALRRVVASAPEHQVAWQAADGAEAVAFAGRDGADLILMDLIMPGVDGVEATRRIMAESPCPILVVTATVSGNIGKVYEAMGLGALDAVDTPTLGLRGELRGGEHLLSKIATVAKLTGHAPRFADPGGPVASPVPRRPSHPPLVALGASTGGPSALAEILSAFPKGLRASVVMIQHVDAAFAPGLARWLRDRTGHDVEVARDGAYAAPGRYFLAGTNDHLVLDLAARFRYTAEPRDSNFRPSVDVFFRSAAEHWPGTGVAALLTGMGRDGAAGLSRLQSAGWLTIAQDEPTSVVWGMPRAAVESGAAALVLPVTRIGPVAVEHLRNVPSYDEIPL